MKKLIACILALLCMTVPALAQTYVYDPSGVFSETQTANFESRMSALCETYDIDLLLAITDDSEGYEAYDYAPLIYEALRNGDIHPDYAVLAVCLDNRTYGFDATGRLGDVVNDYGIANAEDMLLSPLSAGNYARAMSDWLDLLDDLCTPDSAFDAANGLFLFVLIIAALIALIVVMTMKSKLKTARFANSANQYVDENSLQLTTAHEFFLYETVHRQRIESSSSSGKSGGGGSRARGGGSF